MDIDILQEQIDIILSSIDSIDQKLQKICNYLQKEVTHYDWVGFYFKNGNKNELKLAQYTGEDTEHTIIPFGKGICGQVAVSNEPFIVQDVSKQEQIQNSAQTTSVLVRILTTDGKIKDVPLPITSFQDVANISILTE